MTSTLFLLKTTDKVSGPETLSICLEDCSAVKKEVLSYQWETITIEVKKEKSIGFLYPTFESASYLTGAEYGESLSGGIKTQRWAYASGTKKGLLVMESKKKSNEKQPYRVTVAHYYVNSGGSDVDVGFSVVVRIRVVNGKLDFIVDGPVEHPTSALHYMIEQVCRTEKWKPSACPHCKDLQSQQRRWVSDSEDSDSNLLTPPPSHGGQQSVSNMGRYNGDGIGNIIQAKEVNFNKWWMMRRFRN
ncbi:uncharacterized protein LOC106761464 [Vigna radiata var. radiata]|uniref:Uncharacterized protein LOC106761464 n=1 Tax=Vigna radiata var. radiata TaxID=3916 RepID=A0A1S3U3D9_VIGRR|nr:uncharacterized protein LOC106761464 [Vigna radiata var. radiata]